MGFRESDLDLMLRVRDDDHEAFAELMDRYRDRLISLFASLSRDGDLADDLFQETFIRLWKARHRYQPTARLSTYLIEIAKNLWLNEKPRWKRRQQTRSLSDDGADGDEAEGRLDALQIAAVDVAGMPEEALLQKERSRRIEAAVGDLPPHLALVFSLSQMEGYRYREIAAMLGIAEGTVKWRMSEAVHRLRESLSDL